MSKALTSLNSPALRRYSRICSGVGVFTIFGWILYKKNYVHKIINKFTDVGSTDGNRKRPDYIYIKYHIYRESMRKLKQQEENEKKWISIIINPISKWWKSFKHSVAWRLLNIAQNGSQAERLKAVRQLASIDHLKDWDFRHLAQICDARTAVSLARSGADTRWFLPVPMQGCIKNPKIIISTLRDVLTKLKSNSCVENFFAKYFPEQVVSDKDAIDKYIALDEVLPAQDTDMLKEIISFLHHITKDVEVSKQILKEGILVQLLEMLKIFGDDNETLSTLCKVLANMSLVRESIEDFFVTGWIGVLARWQRCHDLRLQVISAKTIANLDHDDPNYISYPPNIYPLHPRVRTRTKPKCDIVFIHGLLGGVFITWRQKDRRPVELGLYGKNAFYISETDDVFLVGEQRRLTNVHLSNGNGRSDIKTMRKPVVRLNANVMRKRRRRSVFDISDVATKELLETLRNAAELESDWEVVHPDIPLKANDNCDGEFSVSGLKWENQDHDEDYTNCWPMEWLSDDHPNARIIGIDYTSALTEWSANFTKYCPCEKGQGQIDVRATSLLKHIAKSEVGDGRPVVWIGHSMGGILTKLMLIKALQDGNPETQQVAKNTRAIVFLGTPHRGSPIAKWKQHMQMILSPSIEVKEMEEGAPKLLELHNNFMHYVNTTLHGLKIVSVAEGSPTMLTSFKFPLRIVTEDSARIDYGDFYILRDDHLSLSKPIFRQSFLYQRILKVINESISDHPVADLELPTQDQAKVFNVVQQSALVHNVKDSFASMVRRFKALRDTTASATN